MLVPDKGVKGAGRTSFVFIVAGVFFPIATHGHLPSYLKKMNK